MYFRISPMEEKNDFLAIILLNPGCCEEDVLESEGIQWWHGNIRYIADM